MFFQSAPWLFLLIPWTALAIFLLRDVPPGAGVPFLFLWPEDPAPRTRDRRWRLPPFTVILLLASMALAIVGAAGPRMSSGQGVSIVLIVDRGLTMSALDDTAHRRFVEAALQAAEMLKRERVNARVTLQPVPATDTVASADWLNNVLSLEPTTVDTSSDIKAAIHSALAASDGAVFVLSDQSLHIQNPRVIQIVPPSRFRNVAVAGLNARVVPPQAMVTISNDSNLQNATLNVIADGKSVASGKIDLSSQNQQQNYFIDLPPGSKVIEAEIECDDNFDLDHRAWIIRREAWPNVEAHSALPPELRRMIEVYDRHRPSSPDSPHVAVLCQGEPIPPHSAVVIVASGTTPLLSQGPVSIDAPINFQGVNWPAALANATIANPPESWQTAVTAGGATLIALRAGEPKVVWVGFSSPTFSREAAYVIFWTRLFDYLGAGVPEFSSHPVHPLGPQWHHIEHSAHESEPGLTPGLYQNAEGEMLAINAAISSNMPATDNVMQSQWQPGQVSASPDPYLFFFALFAALTAMLACRGARRPPREGCPFRDSAPLGA